MFNAPGGYAVEDWLLLVVVQASSRPKTSEATSEDDPTPGAAGVCHKACL